MVKILKNSRGDSSVMPILLILIVSFFAITTILVKQIDGNLIAMQKSRYEKAISMAINTSLATVELSDDSNLEAISMGYTVHNQMMLDKTKLAKVFEDVLYRNVQAKSVYQKNQFNQYIPLMGVLQNDRISFLAYCGKDLENPNSTTLTPWQDYPLYVHDEADGKRIYLTLGDDYFTLIDESIPWTTESNRNYDSLSNLNMTEKQKNELLYKVVKDDINSFANTYKESHNHYTFTLRNFDKNSFLASINDVTVFCVVEGIPIKTILSNEPDKSFYMAKFGGASLKRADQ